MLVLLESPGEIVPKEVLRARLWNDRVFGEVDSSLHVAAAKLREALGEKAGSAQYIETMRRRGYRFNGKVEQIFSATPEPTPEPESLPEPASEPDPESVAPAPEPPQKRPRRPILLSAVAVLLFLAFIGAAFWLHHRSRIPLSGKAGEVVLGGFANNSGDDSYNGLGPVLRVKLEESPYLSLLPDQRLLHLEPQPSAAPLPKLLAACGSLGGKILITGEIRSHAHGFVLSTTAHNCTNGALIAQQRASAANRNEVFAALDQTTDQMRKDLGESDASRQKFNVSLAQATTGSLAALRSFTLGEEKRASGQEFESIPDYKLAIDLDPQFALAYARLGTIYFNANELTESSRYFQKAFDLREHTSDHERLYIASHYYSISGQIGREMEAYDLWRSLYPRDPSPYNNMAFNDLALGDPEKAASAARAAVQLDEATSLAQPLLARAYLETGEHEKLRAICNNAEGGVGDNAMLHESCFLLAFLQHDEAAMQKQIQWSHGSAAESELLDDVAWVEMYQGKLESGHKLFAQSRQSALAQGFSELAATADVDEATLDADLGYPREAHALALDAVRLAPANVSILALAALALARSHDTAAAESLADKAAAAAPLNTLLNNAEIPSVRAAIALERHNPQAALQALEPARAYDRCNCLALAPAYYRGLAYQAAGQPDKAAAEFRTLISHRLIAPDSPYLPLAASALSKLPHNVDTDAARNLVNEAWQHADPDFAALHPLSRSAQ